MSQAAKAVTTAESFFDLDVRVGRVVEASPHPAARVPAYLIRVDFGPLGPKTTSARATHYAPDALVGRLVVGVVNIGTRRIGGVKSGFLLLGAYGDDGTVRLLAPDPGAQPGDAVG
jgi:tRNA-binding protein